MTKTGIRKIKIAKKNEVADSFFDKTEKPDIIPAIFHELDFVQDSAVLTDEETEDDNGFFHDITLSFVIRADFNHWRKIMDSYTNTPVIILIIAVNGDTYTIGTRNAPAFVTTRMNYDKIAACGLSVSCSYKNTQGLFEVEI